MNRSKVKHKLLYFESTEFCSMRQNLWFRSDVDVHCKVDFFEKTWVQSSVHSISQLCFHFI